MFLLITDILNKFNTEIHKPFWVLNYRFNSREYRFIDFLIPIYNLKSFFIYFFNYFFHFPFNLYLFNTQESAEAGTDIIR